MAPDAPTLVRDEAPAASPPPPRAAAPALPVAAPRELSARWAAVLGLGWPVAVAAATALEPAPADPSAAVSPVAGLLGLLFAAGLVTVVASAAARRARTPLWASGLGVLALGLVVACPASGHHGFGAWWIAELAVYGVMGGISLAALRASGRAQRSMSPRMK